MTPAGLSAASRSQLSKLLRDSPPIVTPSQAAAALGLTPAAAARRLAVWSRAGWLARVRRGAYVPVPIESESADVALDDAWPVAAAMFSPCYIGGWSAAEHWGLTEQLFRSICVMTTTRPRERQPVLRKARFELHTVAPARFIGLKTVWRGGTRVQVSDPARTLIDMLADPALGGGIRHVAEMLGTLFHDQPKEAAKLSRLRRQDRQRCCLQAARVSAATRPSRPSGAHRGLSSPPHGGLRQARPCIARGSTRDGMASLGARQRTA